MVNPAAMSAQDTMKPIPVNGQRGIVGKIASKIAATNTAMMDTATTGRTERRRRTTIAATRHPMKVEIRPVIAKNHVNPTSHSPGIRKRAATMAAGSKETIAPFTMLTGVPND